MMYNMWYYYPTKLVLNNYKRDKIWNKFVFLRKKHHFLLRYQKKTLLLQTQIGNYRI